MSLETQQLGNKIKEVLGLFTLLVKGNRSHLYRRERFFLFFLTYVKTGDLSKGKRGQELPVMYHPDFTMYHVLITHLYRCLVLTKQNGVSELLLEGDSRVYTTHHINSYVRKLRFSSLKRQSSLRWGIEYKDETDHTSR